MFCVYRTTLHVLLVQQMLDADVAAIILCAIVFDINRLLNAAQKQNHPLCKESTVADIQFRLFWCKLLCLSVTEKSYSSQCCCDADPTTISTPNLCIKEARKTAKLDRIKSKLKLISFTGTLQVSFDHLVELSGLTLNLLILTASRSYIEVNVKVKDPWCHECALLLNPFLISLLCH